MTSDRDTRRFFIVLAVSSLFRLSYLEHPNLVPQEAYHWAWGQMPDWSYFDHPPLVAYSITAFTRLFGDSVFWVRFPVWLYSAGGALLLYAILARLGCAPRAALFTLVLYNVTPILLIGSVVMTPDVPLAFFWLLTNFLLLRALDDGSWWRWMLAGLAAGLAMLAKYPGVLLFPGTLLFLLLSPRDRAWLRRPHPYLALLPALAAFSPVLYWNASHGFASFLFQTADRAQSMKSFRLDTPLTLIGQQAAVVTPVVFGLFVWAMVTVVRRRLVRSDRRCAFLFSFAVVPLLVCAGLSTVSFVKMNWTVPAYLTGLALVALLLSERWEQRAVRRWGVAALWTAVPFALLAYALPVVPIRPVPGNTWDGWPELGRRVSEIQRGMERANRTFLFGNRYKVSAEMWFYNSRRERTFAQNVLGQPALSFDYWESPDTRKGWDAVFAWADIEPFRDPEALRSRFERIEAEPPFEIRRGGDVYRRFFIYRCYGYKGVRPNEANGRSGP